jgi:beta-hydroxyacyl-ACP dehydratase FabZ
MNNQELNQGHATLQRYPHYLSCKDITKFLEHRYPFLLIDTATMLSPKECIAQRNISLSDQCFTGHFPSEPVLPGVLQIEAMAQSACILMNFHNQTDDRTYTTLFSSIEKAKFHKMVRPGDTLKINTTLSSSFKSVHSFNSKCFVNDEITSECNFTAAAKPREEYTLAIIKPNAFAHKDHIIQMIKANDLEIASYYVNNIKTPAYEAGIIAKEKIASLYDALKDKPFFKDNCDFASSGPSVVMVLKGINAIQKYRQLMGAAKPIDQAPKGTIRDLYMDRSNLTKSAVHGSDSYQNAVKEINIFFPNKFPNL